MTEVEREYISFGIGEECVWSASLISDTHISGGYSLYAMSDIMVVHHTDTDEYSVEVNGLVKFPESQKYGPKQYIGDLMDKLREWMISTGRNMDYPVNTYDLFITGANINTRYNSIEELYSSFDKLVTNYTSSCNVD